MVNLIVIITAVVLGGGTLPSQSDWGIFKLEGYRHPSGESSPHQSHPSQDLDAVARATSPILAALNHCNFFTRNC